MSLFTGLFSSKMGGQPSGKKEVAVLVGAGNFELGIVGEVHYQAELEANRFETASLILEDKNLLDQNAVRVEIRRKHVGYLGPEAAIIFRQQLKVTGMSKANGQCQVVIKGGWLSFDGRKGDYLVWLDLPISYQ